MPKFSIVTTTYKHEKFIAITVESIIAQSFVDWELLIGDDSPDNSTWMILQKYVQKYPNKIRAWRNIPNKGIVGNMNFLISQASKDSEYIAFLEWDDIYTHDCLEKKFAIFRQYPEVVLVYSDMDFINAAGTVTFHGLLRSQKTKLYQNQYIPREEYIASKNSPIVSYSSVAIRKSILAQFLPIQSLTSSGAYAVSDYDLFFRISGLYPVFGIHESLTHYRRHPHNLSSNYGWLFDDLMLLIEKYRADNLIGEDIYVPKKSWINILQSLSKLSIWDKHHAWIFFLKSNENAPFSHISHKIGILFFLATPSYITKKILGKIMRRWS